MSSKRFGDVKVKLRKKRAVLKTSHGRYELRRTRGPVRLQGNPVHVNKTASSAIDDPEVGPTSLRILQFETQYLSEYGALLARQGVELHAYLGNNAYAASIPKKYLAQVQEHPFVRGTAEYEVRHKLPAELYARLRGAKAESTRTRYLLKAVSWRAVNGFKYEMGTRRGANAGPPGRHEGPGTYFGAEMTAAECFEALEDPRILWLETLTPMAEDVDVGRELAKLDAVQFPRGTHGPKKFSGRKIKVHLPESVDDWHPEFAHKPIAVWDDGKAWIEHGTASAGVITAKGMKPGYRGVLPDAQVYFTNADAIDGKPDVRMKLTYELVEKHGVSLQSVSWGNSYTDHYTAVSAALDEIAFNFRELLIAQSQGNQGGSGHSRPQSWAKNVVAGLGFSARGTADTDDDTGANTSIRAGREGRIGRSFGAPAAAVKTIVPHGEYWDEFGGTSAATPMIAGLMGVIQEMFVGASFDKAMADSRSLTDEGMAQASTLSAMAIVSAFRHDFAARKKVGLSREAQGWGFPQPQILLDKKDRLFIVNESKNLQALETSTYKVEVKPGEERLNLAMVYVDPAGMPGAPKTQVNNLDLKVTSPKGKVYWGNHGLTEGNVSKPGGKADTVDTVEAILIEKPKAGTWKIEVMASEINRDAIPHTPVDDVNFALAVLGAKETRN